MVYLPTFTIKNQTNVGKYTIHGWYGPVCSFRLDLTAQKFNVGPFVFVWSRCHHVLWPTRLENSASGIGGWFTLSLKKMDPDEPPGFLNVAQIHWQIKKSRILNHLSVLSRGYICNMYPMESRLCFIGISCEFLVVDCWWSLWPHFEIYDASWVFLKITVPQTLCAEHIVASSFLWSTFIIWDIITTYTYLCAKSTKSTNARNIYIYTYYIFMHLSIFKVLLSFRCHLKANDCEKLCGAIQCLLATKESGSSVFCGVE